MKNAKNLFLLFISFILALHVAYLYTHPATSNNNLKADLDGALNISPSQTELYKIPAVLIDGRNIPSTYLHVVNLPHEIKCTRTLYTNEGYRCSRIVE